MKTLIKVLFAGLLLFPLTLSAQWTDGGSYIRTNDNVTIGTNYNAYTFYARTDKNGWQGRFANRKNGYSKGSDVFLSHGNGYGMSVRGYNTTGNYYTLQLHNGVKQTNVFYNDGRVLLGLAGNVGIGTTTPDNKLDVKGVIRAEEVKVETGWSDYVFYDDYALPTLADEEAHIEAKGHLLGFEAEADMNGEVELGDVSKRQQAKIEEMMLHLIDMNKKIEKLKAENTALKAELETIKK